MHVAHQKGPTIPHLAADSHLVTVKARTLVAKGIPFSELTKLKSITVILCITAIHKKVALSRPHPPLKVTSW